MSGPGHNTVRVHLTEGDLLVLERSLPDEVFRRSEAQHIVSRLVGEARHQHIARALALMLGRELAVKDDEGRWWAKVEAPATSYGAAIEQWESWIGRRAPPIGIPKTTPMRTRSKKTTTPSSEEPMDNGSGSTPTSSNG